MKIGIVLIILCSVFNQLWAQEQLALRLNEKGLLKILELGLKYNTSKTGTKSILIPQNVYKLKLPKDKILKNPIVAIVDRFTNINLQKDLPFYLKTSDIKIDGQADVHSFNAEIHNSSQDGFDLALELNLNKLGVVAKELWLCEVDKCKNGLKAGFNKIKIDLKKQVLKLRIALRIRTNEGNVQVMVLGAETNLNSIATNKLGISLGNIIVPDISVIDETGKEVKLDISTEAIKDKVNEQKDFLSKKLLSFAADFIAHDLAGMLNRYLLNKKIQTSLKLLAHNEHDLEGQWLNVASDEAQKIINKIYDVVHQAEIGLSLSHLSAPENKDIELGGDIKLMLNKKLMTFKNTLSNSGRVLPELDLSAYRDNHINLAVSEPVINSVLDAIHETGLINKLAHENISIGGVDISSLKVHFTERHSLSVIANVTIDLSRMNTPNIVSHAKKIAGQFLEKNRTDGKIFFPIEIEVIPNFIKNPKGIGLYLEVLSPFEGGHLINNFNYPSNLHLVTDTVKGIIFKNINSGIGKVTDKFYNIDLSNLLNKAGVEFRPKSISIEKQAYILLNLDILDIKYNAKQEDFRI